MATSLVVESIVKNENRTMPISTLVDGFLGVYNVCLSIPVVVGRNGISQKLKIALNKKERDLFHRSASLVQTEIKKLIK